MIEARVVVVGKLLDTAAVRVDFFVRVELGVQRGDVVAAGDGAQIAEVAERLVLRQTAAAAATGARRVATTTAAAAVDRARLVVVVRRVRLISISGRVVRLGVDERVLVQSDVLQHTASAETNERND